MSAGSVSTGAVQSNTVALTLSVAVRASVPPVLREPVAVKVTVPAKLPIVPAANEISASDVSLIVPFGSSVQVRGRVIDAEGATADRPEPDVDVTARVTTAPLANTLVPAPGCPVAATANSTDASTLSPSQSDPRASA